VHDKAWPGVLAALNKAHFTNYSIFHFPEAALLVGYFEWSGTDWDADMDAVARDDETRRWWQVTDGMQESLVRWLASAQTAARSVGTAWADSPCCERGRFLVRRAAGATKAGGWTSRKFSTLQEERIHQNKKFHPPHCWPLS